MNCPECSGDGRLAVQTTVRWGGGIWRARKCPDCEATVPTVETVASGGWPEGIWNRPGKTAAQRARRNPGRHTVSSGRDDAFDANAGADLAAVMAVFARPVASAQQVACD